jgi:hypothetical protein
MMPVGVIGFCGSSIARADEVLKFRMFMHLTAVQNRDVGDVDGLDCLALLLQLGLDAPD